MPFARRLVASVVFAAAASLAFTARAQQPEIKIGAIYPLTGSAASTGAELKDALEFAADLVNNGSKETPDLPFAAGGGLPGLKGAKVRIVFADHQGNPQVGATEAERLINEEHVVAIIGAYNSNVTATASQIAERSGIPFLNAESSSASLTARGFKWFFRTTPHDDLFVRNFFDFLKDLEAKKKIAPKNIALMNENTLWGNETSKLENKLAGERGYKITSSVIYPAQSTQLTSEVQTLKTGSPQVLMQSSYLGDAILSIKTYKELGFTPDMILANDAGFSDTEFTKTLGKDADYVISREVWSLDLASRNPLIKQTNDAFHKRFNINFTGNSARTFTGIMTLLDAINRAGSTQPEAIRTALKATDLPGSKLIMPWKGVKFDETGQNQFGQGILVQIVGGQYKTVWPFEMAAQDLVWPMPKWSERK